MPSAKVPQIHLQFADDERRLLLSMPGISDGVVARLESVGITSLTELCETGAEVIVWRVVQVVGNKAWHNRRRALIRAIDQAIAFLGEPSPAAGFAVSPSVDYRRAYCGRVIGRRVMPAAPQPRA